MTNSGPALTVDLYCLLDVFGEYWCYPSWCPIEQGLDHETMVIHPGERRKRLIEEFVMPAVSPLNPLYFYAALFEEGELGPEALIGHGAVYYFRIQ